MWIQLLSLPKSRIFSNCIWTACNPSRGKWTTDGVNADSNKGRKPPKGKSAYTGIRLVVECGALAPLSLLGPLFLLPLLPRPLRVVVLLPTAPPIGPVCQVGAGGTRPVVEDGASLLPLPLRVVVPLQLQLHLPSSRWSGATARKRPFSSKNDEDKYGDYTFDERNGEPPVG